MGSFGRTAKIVCPFYLQEEERALICEGLGNGQCSIVNFDGEYQKLAWIKTKCQSFRCYELCPVAEALYKKYAKDA